MTLVFHGCDNSSLVKTTPLQFLIHHIFVIVVNRIVNLLIVMYLMKLCENSVSGTLQGYFVTYLIL